MRIRCEGCRRGVPTTFRRWLSYQIRHTFKPNVVYIHTGCFVAYLERKVLTK